MAIPPRINNLILLLLSLTLIPISGCTTPRVAYVYDGDTVKIQTQMRSFKLRLKDIDAPEHYQPHSNKSRNALIKLCQGPHIDIQYHLTGTDKYQRALGSLHCNQVDVSAYMVEHGHAWMYSQYSADAQLETLQKNAQTQHLGLWRDKNPVPPWQWRKQHPQSH